MIVATTVPIEFGDQDAGGMMFLIRLVHNVLANMAAYRRIEDLFFDRGVDLNSTMGAQNNPQGGSQVLSSVLCRVSFSRRAAMVSSKRRAS